MALYEEVYYQLINYPKFYRYEGVKTHRNYNFEDEEVLANIESYIYFSKTLKHHEYYVQRRIRQQIERDILYQTKYSLQKGCVINNEKFQAIVTIIENYPLEAKPSSIEFTTSPFIKKLFAKNYYIENAKKKDNIPFIERVDKTKSGGRGVWIMQRLVRSI